MARLSNKTCQNMAKDYVKIIVETVSLYVFEAFLVYIHSTCFVNSNDPWGAIQALRRSPVKKVHITSISFLFKHLCFLPYRKICECSIGHPYIISASERMVILLKCQSVHIYCAVIPFLYAYKTKVHRKEQLSIEFLGIQVLHFVIRENSIISLLKRKKQTIPNYFN